MKSNRENFLELRAEEISVMYDPLFTKKDAIASGKKLVQTIFEEGNFDKLKTWANICRLKEVVNAADAEFRSRSTLFEKQFCYGVEFNNVNGGESINYDEDPIYSQLKDDIKDREAKLKMAQKSELFDQYGNAVPKVSTTPRKSSITIKF